jgi:hypothetical protein
MKTPRDVSSSSQEIDFCRMLESDNISCGSHAESFKSFQFDWQLGFGEENE